MLCRTLCKKEIVDNICQARIVMSIFLQIKFLIVGVVLIARKEWNETNWGMRQVEKSFETDFASFPTATQ